MYTFIDLINDLFNVEDAEYVVWVKTPICKLRMDFDNSAAFTSIVQSDGTYLVISNDNVEFAFFNDNCIIIKDDFDDEDGCDYIIRNGEIEITISVIVN